MPAQSLSPSQRLSAFLARGIVRLWPAETREWGLAFEAELPEITTPLASVRWVFGGIMLLARERWKSFFRSFGRPIGVPAGSPLEAHVRNSRRVPRTPRFVTSFLFLASAAILLHPDVRSCILLSFRSLSTGVLENDLVWKWPSQWGSVRRLFKEAETNRDPKLLALLSLLSTDSDERLRLSEEAIQKDPSLTWLDHEQFRNQEHTFVLPESRLERLQKWDPGNGAFLELAARAAAYRSGKEWGDVQWPKPQYVQKSGLTQMDEAPPDAQWLSAMATVYAAPKYDSHLDNEFDLIRDVSQKYGIRDPDITLYLLASHNIPNMMNLKSYNNWLLGQSERKEQAGDHTGALADARKALGFSQRMWLGQTSMIELLIAESLGIKACERLQALLKEPGQAGEASLVAFQKAEWNADIERSRFAVGLRDQGMQQTATWTGTTILLATGLILVTSLVSCVSILALWLKRNAVDTRGRSLVFLSWALDAAPVILLGACAVVYLSYQPFARTYHAYFTARKPISDFEGLLAAGTVTHVWPSSVTHVLTPFLFWTITTVGLSLLAAFLLIRMAARRLRHT
jgi:hypothetical protein